MQLYISAFSCHGNILYKNAGKATSLLIKALYRPCLRKIANSKISFEALYKYLAS